jgi:hypothetical protein
MPEEAPVIKAVLRFMGSWVLGFRFTGSWVLGFRFTGSWVLGFWFTGSPVPQHSVLVHGGRFSVS